jgi:TonB family protein
MKMKARPVTPVPSQRLAVTLPKIEIPVLQVQQPQRVRRIAEVAEVPQPQVAIASPRYDSKVLNALPGPKAPKIIATNTFGGSSATPTLQKIAPSKVQTGGFGDPNGVPVNAHGSNHPNIAAAGSFDLPTGGGYGNGTGGTSGARGTVASAGFGNGVAVQGGGGRGGNAGQGRVQSTSFVSATSTPTPDDGHRARAAASYQAVSVPVSIQSKPTPVYTPEARQLKVEGEVLLNVVFTAGGQIRILNVVHGLGHGLDEAAQHAAQGVRFSPAMRDGHPVDSNVTLHIVFQLS